MLSEVIFIFNKLITFKYVAFVSILGFKFTESLTSDLRLIQTKRNEPATNTDLLNVNSDYKHTRATSA